MMEGQAPAAEAQQRAEAVAREAVGRLAEPRQQAEAAAWYEHGVQAAERSDWVGASAAFEQVERIAPGYRDAPARLMEAQARATEAQQRAEAVAREAVARLAEARQQGDAAAWYEHGVQAAERSDWVGASAAFEQVERIAPGYRDAPARLMEAQ